MPPSNRPAAARGAMCILLGLALFLANGSAVFAAQAPPEGPAKAPIWNQWRGPTRDGQVGGPAWPKDLSAKSLELRWRVRLGPSYSGPIVADDLVFTTETKNKESEVVFAFDRKTGAERWRAEWQGAITVPFFAKSNGDWIRSTPAYDGEYLFVGGIRDVLVCLEAKTGKEVWRVDFVKEFSAPPPAFGMVCSPLVAGEAVYVQAAASVVKLDRKSGKILWRVLKDEGGAMDSAFSSPIVAELAGKKQLLVQTREKLAGLDMDSGAVLWSQVVPSFRGMNILTPVVFGDGVFTSTYQNKSWLYKITRSKEQFAVAEAWSTKAQGYMSTPVVVAGHAYFLLQNQRMTCINLKTGDAAWSSQPLGKYCSLVAQGDRILALDERGILLLFKANPKEFELLDQRTISEEETWAHLAVCGDEVYVRELNALAVYRWQAR